MLICPYRYWHCCTLVQYQYGHSPLPILAFNCASTVIGISTFWFSTSMITVHYQQWHSLIVPILLLAFLHLGSVPVLAHTITGTGIQKWCPYRYWCCTLVHHRYGHSSLLVLAFNFAHTGIDISALRFSTGTGTVHYPHWHSKMEPVLVLAFLHFGSVPVWAYSITGTGIQQWFQYRYWNFCTLVHYQYWHGSLLLLAFDSARSGIGIFGILVQYQYGIIPLPVLVCNMARTGNGISALHCSTGIGTFHYRYWHSTMVPVLVWAFLHFGLVPV